MNLQEEINAKTKEFRTDSYPMSIGEITNLYKSNEIIINPEFQRYFRWSRQQKSKLIESILLGIPIPPIFVYQREDGIWELVDGLQRVSTILEFIGELKDTKGNLKVPLALEATKILPSLQDVVWEKQGDEKNSLPKPLQLQFKRAKLKVEIIQKESDINAKFEVFERLNTGGSFLSYQEVRNCLLIMINKDVYNWLSNLAENEDFQSCISITDRLIQERYDMELALRYLACAHFELTKDVNEFLTDSLMQIVQDTNFDYTAEKQKFEKLFSLLNGATGEGTFKKYDGKKFGGKFLESAFEAITVGIFANLEDYTTSSAANTIESKIKGMWSEEEYTKNSGAGSNAQTRIPRLIRFGKRYYKNEQGK